MHIIDTRSATAPVLRPVAEGGTEAEPIPGRAWLDHSAASRIGVRLAAAAVLSCGILVLALSSPAHPNVVWLELVLAAVAVFVCGLPLLQRAAASVVRRRPDMFALVSLGTLTALAHGALATALPALYPGAHLSLGAAAVVVTLVLAGEALERAARGRAVRELDDEGAVHGVLHPGSTHMESFADRVSAALVPAVLVVAAITFVGWLALGPSPRLPHAITSAASVLIIACPAAIGLATPLSFLVATVSAKRSGIRLGDAESTELLARLTTLVIDRGGLLAEDKSDVEHVRSAIADLRRMGVRVVLMTREGRTAGREDARRLDLHEAEVYADMSAEDRVSAVRDLARRGEIVAVALRGPRDERAASAGHLGITLGDGDGGNIAVYDASLAGIVRAVRLARRTARNARQNLAIAFLYNVAAIPLAAGLCYVVARQPLSPMIAAAATGLSTITIIASSLRLLRGSRRMTRGMPRLQYSSR